RRIWIELCKAVGWMHGVGLVHRDIKLENILLTAPVFSSLDPTSPPPTLASLPALPAPFIKLTDFGLSRFVELDAHGDAEPLSTRCGSEAYAAPELVTGGGVYDARKTDAWACGVVLYAL
ncbi:Pkinase-domain-containing protein, partial [Pholiota conissans]